MVPFFFLMPLVGYVYGLLYMALYYGAGVMPGLLGVGLLLLAIAAVLYLLQTQHPRPPMHRREA